MRLRRKVLALTHAAFVQHVGRAEVTTCKLETDAFRPSRDFAEHLATRGERCIDRLPIPHHLVDPARPDPAHLPLPVASRATPCQRLCRYQRVRGWISAAIRSSLVEQTSCVGSLARSRFRAMAAFRSVEVAAAMGLGSIGKPQLVCEFVHRYGQLFAGVYSGSGLLILPLYMRNWRRAAAPKGYSSARSSARCPSSSRSS